MVTLLKGSQIVEPRGRVSILMDTLLGNLTYPTVLWESWVERLVHHVLMVSHFALRHSILEYLFFGISRCK